MKKKLTAMLLAFAMLLAMLTGCGGMVSQAENAEPQRCRPVVRSCMRSSLSLIFYNKNSHYLWIDDRKCKG